MTEAQQTAVQVAHDLIYELTRENAPYIKAGMVLNQRQPLDEEAAHNITAGVNDGQ